MNSGCARKRSCGWVLATIFLLAGGSFGAGGEGASREDPWCPVRFLLGDWQGSGSSFGTRSRVTHSYEFVIQDRFLHMRTRSVSEPASGAASGEVHEDWGFFSYDSDRDRLMLRQFLSEGYVNTYVLEEGPLDGTSLTFTSESTEGAGGTRARLRFTIPDEDHYEVKLDLAPPGKEFFTCQTVTMERVR